MYKYGVQSTVVFKAVQSADGVSPATGLTSVTLLCYISKDGGAFTACTNAATEIGRGWYKLVLTATEMQAESIAIDFTATGAIVAGIPIHTEADYTAARAAHLDADVSSRLATGTVASDVTAIKAKTDNLPAAPADETLVIAATTSIMSRLGAPVGASISADIAGVQADTDNIQTRIPAALVGGRIDASVGAMAANTLTASALATDAVTEIQTGLATSTAVASLQASVDAITTATNAGDMTTKTPDSATLTTGSTISGSVSNTSTDDDVYWITAPVSPAVGGFGLRQQLVFDLPLGRTPVNIQIRGWFNGSGRTVEVYALNSRTGVFDQLTNSRTDLASRNSELLYAIPLPRDYGDNTGGAFNIVTLEFRSTSTTTADRLRLDQVLVTHVAEAVASTFTAPSAEQIWTYVTRELTSPGVEPVVVPTAAEVRAEIDANSTQLAAIKAKTDNLPSDPADESLIIAATDAVMTRLGAPAGASIAADVAAVKVDVDAVPTATQNADALLNRDMSAVADTTARSPLNALRLLRNKWSVAGATLTVTKEDDTAAAWTAAVATTPGADPISGSDPA